MIRKIVLFIILFFCVLVSNSQVIIPKERGSHEEPVYAKHYFGIRLVPTAQSKAVTYIIYSFFYDSTKNYQVITKHEFMSQFSGGIDSKANPEGKNLFNEYKIDPRVFEHLWKVRYPEYPFGKDKIPGWAGGNFIPSKAQMKMLKPFGVNHPADMIYGDSLISFLRSVSDAGWVNQYKAR
ncbi:MAG TPA: hypothetical protein VJ937_14825 [Salinivirga sp.]|uniref:hypothetical protein n=1 Tax=Salinivirga sp. TaxID=1970192 RepID=UPI002B485AB8|nr:hypothetical protein [Salinivirga sp.]HKK60752.1 hypothetical protein [Salinivirga sp.]